MSVRRTRGGRGEGAQPSLPPNQEHTLLQELNTDHREMPKGLKPTYVPAVLCAEVFINPAVLSSKTKTVDVKLKEGSRGKELESSSPFREPWRSPCAFLQLRGTGSQDAGRGGTEGSPGAVKTHSKDRMQQKVTNPFKKSELAIY